MSRLFSLNRKQHWTRRRILQYGFAGGAAIAAFKLLQNPNSSLAATPPLTEQDLEIDGNLTFNPMSILRDFDYGTLKQENGKAVREFEVVANSSVIKLNSAISYISWNLNGRNLEGQRGRTFAGYFSQSRRSFSQYALSWYSPRSNGRS